MNNTQIERFYSLISVITKINKRYDDYDAIKKYLTLYHEAVSSSDKIAAFMKFWSLLEILVFLLLGFIVNVNFNGTFILKSLAVFIGLIFTRFLAVKFVMKDYLFEEKIYMVLNMPKGIAVAVLIFSLSLMGVPELDLINNLLVFIIIYSLSLSTFINRFSEKFIKVSLH